MRAESTNPYVGLRSFDVEESILFFGRYDQTLELLQRLHLHHFVAVVGSSGSGKSSLLRAGLIPALKAGYLVDDSDKWVISIMKPGQSPLYNLAESILLQENKGVTVAAIAGLVKNIQEKGVDAIIEIVGRKRNENGRNYFLLIDQFEELFRLSPDQNHSGLTDEAIDFVNIILELSKQTDLPFYIVITMRSDFIGDCARFYNLPEAMNESQYLVPRLNRVQLKMVIEGPAKLYGGNLNPVLTSRLLNELGTLKDELPLLQHALMRIWDYKKSISSAGELDLQDYETVGGIEKALSNHADEALENMNEEDVLLARKIFQSLTAIDENGRKIRRPVLLSQLAIITGAKEMELMRIMDCFIKDKRSFLLITKAGDSGDKIIDISHESLIRQWGTLCKWVDEDGESAAIYLQLAEAAKLHAKNKKDFLTGSELQLALDWNERYKPNASWANRYDKSFDESMAYLRASEMDRDLIRGLERAKQRKRRKWVIGVMLLLLIFAVGAGIATLYSNHLKKITANQFEAFFLHAKAHEILVDDPTLALQLEVAAHEKLNSPIFEQEAYKIYRENSFYKIFKNFNSTIYSIAYSPDGSAILAGFEDSTACLLDLNGVKLMDFKGHAGRVNSVAFSPDGKSILTGSWDKTARLWNLQGNVIQEFKGHSGPVYSAVFSPDGKSILTGSLDSTARLWDLEGKTITQFKGHTDCVYPVLFSPACPNDPVGGKYILTGSMDNTARLWDRRGKMQQEFTGHINDITSLAFSPDGKNILTGSNDKSAWLWNLGGNVLQKFIGHSDFVYSVAFSPPSPDDPSGGKKILTASRDNTCRLWDLKGNTLQEFKGHIQAVMAATFSIDGQKILSCSKDKTARIWELKVNAILEIKPEKYGDDSFNSIWSVSFSPDGKKILTGSHDNLVQLWDIKGNKLQVFKGHTGDIYSVAFSPAGPGDPVGGNTILTGSIDSTARLWDINGKTIQIFKGHTDIPWAAAFSPDGKTILTGSADSTARLWDLKGNTLTIFKGHSDAVRYALFSPDGKSVLTTSWDNTARLWDLKGNLLRIFKGHTGWVNAAAFSPASPDDPNGGKTILTGSLDKTARLWDLNGNVLQEFKGHAGNIRAVAFSPNGKTILTGSGDNTARLWDLKGNLLQVFTGHTDGVWSACFSPDGKTILTGSADNTARVWSIPMPLNAFIKTDKIEPLSADQKLFYGVKD